jgi:hypothetical protein
MKPEASIGRTDYPNTMAARLRSACAPKLAPLPLLLMMALPAVAEAQCRYTNNEATLTITGYTGPGGAVTIPGTINGLPVTSIGAKAFFFCASLTDLTIGNNVTSIGVSAFSGCPSLTSVTIGRSVTNIGDSAFWWCPSLTNVTIANGVPNIGAAAFASCASLTRVTIGNGLTNIGASAFASCTSLTSVTIPKSVISIMACAFERCIGLKAVYFRGNAPRFDWTLFDRGSSAIVYYLPGTTGWGSHLAGRPTALWKPETQTEAQD